jgi:hypothetical protein
VDPLDLWLDPVPFLSAHNISQLSLNAEGAARSTADRALNLKSRIASTPQKNRICAKNAGKHFQDKN